MEEGAKEREGYFRDLENNKFNRGVVRKIWVARSNGLQLVMLL